MSGLLRISDAAAIGIHGMVVLGLKDGETVSAPHIAEMLSISLAHLSKVMRQLVHSELVTPVRGPTGGYRLGRPAEEIRLMDILEAIDGPFPTTTCLLGRPICHPCGCLFTGLAEEVRETVTSYLTATTLAMLVDSYRSKQNG